MVWTKRRARGTSTSRERSKVRLRGWDVGQVTYSDQVAGPDVTSASLEEVIEAISRQSPDLPWGVAATQVLPLIPRLRAYPPGSPSRVSVMVPPGIAVGFGVDFGPGFMNVTVELRRHWSISFADLTEQALRNVHDRARQVTRSEIHHGGCERVASEWLQTNRSIGSLLVMAPTELTRLFGREPRRFITPMRDLIIGFPAAADPKLVAWHYAEIAAQDPNCLGPMSYLSVDGRVTPQPLEQLVGRLPSDLP